MHDSMINLGLSRISALISHLPTKQTWKAIHIAGTNGKGSVAAYLSSLFLRCSLPVGPNKELKIGRFISPHVIDRWDCITINDQPVSESLFLRVEKEVGVYAAAAALELESATSSSTGNEAQASQVTEFELLTATAFEIFSQQNCQVAIIECGLGGRLDATNVLEATDVACSVITKIGLDHMGLLGNTVQQIAKEKAGIAKQGVPMVVDGTNDKSVQQAIEQVSTSKGATTVMYSDASNTETQNQLSQLHLPLHQQHNLALALTAFNTAQPDIPMLSFTSSTSISTSTLTQILSDVRTSYPARLQHLPLSPLIPRSTYPHQILLDGAHNPQSAQVLHDYITSHQQASRSLIFILGLSRGKSIPDILDILLDPRDGTHVVATPFTPPDNMPWISCTPPGLIAEYARTSLGEGHVHVASDAVDALRMAVEIANSGHDRGSPREQTEGNFEIVVAGSLYLASDVLRALRDGEAALTKRFRTTHGGPET